MKRTLLLLTLASCSEPPKQDPKPKPDIVLRSRNLFSNTIYSVEAHSLGENGIVKIVAKMEDIVLWQTPWLLKSNSVTLPSSTRDIDIFIECLNSKCKFSVTPLEVRP